MSPAARATAPRRPGSGPGTRLPEPTTDPRLRLEAGAPPGPVMARWTREPDTDPATRTIAVPRGAGRWWEWLLFTAFGLLVVAPWIAGGWLLLLDWVNGPNLTLTNGAYGLDPSQLDAMPMRVALAALRAVAGPEIAGWLPILAFFPVAGVGMASLVGGSTVRRLAAGALFVANPFVFERLRAGQILVLLGFALLPWLLRSFLAARAENRWFRVRSAAWLALAVSVSPHVFFPAVVLLAATLIWPKPTARDLVRSGLTVVAAAGVYAYGLALYIAGVHTVAVGTADLAAFATAGDSAIGQLARLVGLEGFWREGPGMPRDLLGPAWFAALAGVLAVVFTGLRAGWNDPERRTVTVAAGTAGLAGLLLAGGATGLFGGLYQALFDLVPLFEVMREAQKWVMLLALAYAVGFGFGADALVSRIPLPVLRRPVRRPLVAAGLVALPIAFTANLFGGLAGQVSTTEYPASWYEAEAAMGPGTEAALFLPWHQYQSFPFTDGRAVRTPGEAFFSRPVVSADAVELPELRSGSVSPRAAYLDALLARGGQLERAGALLAPLGIEYVVVSRSGDPAEDAATSWVDRQADLELVLQGDDLAIYRNTMDATGRVGAPQVVDGIDDAIARANAGTLGAGPVVLAGTPELAAFEAAADGAPDAAPVPGDLERPTPVRYQAAAGAPGWLAVPEAAHPGWTLDGASGVPTLAGTLAWPVGAEAAEVTYEPWRAVQFGYAASLAVLAALFGIGLLEHRAEVRRLAAAGAAPLARRVRMPGRRERRNTARDTRSGTPGADGTGPDGGTAATVAPDEVVLDLTDRSEVDAVIDLTDGVTATRLPAGPRTTEVSRRVRFGRRPPSVTDAPQA